MSKRKLVPFLLIIAAVFFLAGCQPGEGDPELAIASQPMLQQQVSFPFPYIDVTTYDGDPPPDDTWVGTSVPPYYSIIDGYLMNCMGDDYIVLQVHNWSGWSFQYLTMGASNGVESWYVWPKISWAFHNSGNECPLAPPTTHLGPGENAFLYLPVNHTYGNNSYEIWVNMCTYIGDPPSSSENCVLRHYWLHVPDPPYFIIFIEVIKEWTCLESQHPDSENIGNIMEGDIVQFLGLGESDSTKVNHPKWLRPCWAPNDVFRFPDPDVTEGFVPEDVPPSPSDCPKGTEWDPKTETCVEKEKKDNCTKYTSATDCRGAGCTWVPDYSCPTCGTCKP